MDKPSVSERRSQVAVAIQNVLPFVKGEKYDDNKRTIETALSGNPQIQDRLWERLSFLAGLYGRFMGRLGLTLEQRLGLWEAVVWATWYERQYHPRNLAPRFADLVDYLIGSGKNRDQFLERAVVDLTELLPELNRECLEKLQKSIAVLPKNSLTMGLKEAAEARLASVQEPREISAISRLWNYLDRNREAQNQQDFDRARTGQNDPQGRTCLARLSRAIAAHALRSYFGGDGLTDQQITDSLLLATFAANNTEGDLKSGAVRNQMLLGAIRDLRRDSLEPEEFSNTCDNVLASYPDPHDREDREVWKNILTTITYHLESRYKPDDLRAMDRIRSEAETWARVFARRKLLLEEKAIRQFLGASERVGIEGVSVIELRTHLRQNKEVDSNRPLDFLSEKQLETLVEHCKNSRFPKLLQLLREVRQPLLAALNRELADPAFPFDRVLAPRFPLSIPAGGRKSREFFERARTMILSSDAQDVREGVEIFKQAQRDITHPDDAPLAREWYLFAQAQQLGPVSVVEEWEKDRTSRPSWEELWNLAVFYSQAGSVSTSLDYLRLGVDSLTAPISHLRFALYCALQAVEQPDLYEGDKHSKAIAFLLEHLLKLPIPECYLTCLLLTDEAGRKKSVMEQVKEQAQLVGNFLKIRESPVRIPGAEEDLKETQLREFAAQLTDLRLEYTWIMWINDFAERNPNFHLGWQLLSEACERASNLDNRLKRAEDALQRIVASQMRRVPPDQRNLKKDLQGLFEFYKKNLLTEGKKAAYKYYSNHRVTRKLWDASDPSNNYLIGLTRDVMEIPTTQTTERKTGGTIPKSSGTSGSGSLQPPVFDWLVERLLSVSNISGLKELREKVELWIDTRIKGPKVVQERALFLKNLMRDIVSLERAEPWKEDELHERIKAINRAIENARTYTEQEPELKPLRALATSFRKAFQHFSETRMLQAVPIVSHSDIGAGLPDDVPKTSLIIEIENPGPGELLDLKVSCTDGGVISSRAEKVLAFLPEHVKETVAVPVLLNVPPNQKTVACSVTVNYRWGVLGDLKTRRDLTVPVFNFRSYLLDHGISGYEIPSPYSDQPIEFRNGDSRVFQGREREIDEIRSLMRGQTRSAPLYYHGIRRVGKTSLLNRIAWELKQGPFHPVSVDLAGISPLSQSLDRVINSFTEKIIGKAGQQGIDVTGLDPIPADHLNPLSAVTPFLEQLSRRAVGRRLVLLLDEFQSIVAESTTPLLDLLRSTSQENLVWYIFSGLARPKQLSAACSKTNLWPLADRAVDFLAEDSVAQVLREPIKPYGVSISDSVVDVAFRQTAGNPYHLALLAQQGIHRLNSEHRTALTPQDVEEIAAKLAEDDGHFYFTSFSSQVLTLKERDEAIRFAKTLSKGQDFMTVQQALDDKFSGDVLDDLRVKHVLELDGENLRINGEMMAVYLKNKISEVISEKDEDPSPKMRVGLFVDYENLRSSIPAGMSTEDVGVALNRYASQFGRVVCRWACFDQRNFADYMGVKMGLERAKFSVSFPRSELQVRDLNKKDTADFVLVERIHEELFNSEPEMCILVSGDKGYYEKVCTLLEDGYAVRVVASESSLAMIYRDLERERRQERAFSDRLQDFYLDTPAGVFSALAGDQSQVEAVP